MPEGDTIHRAAERLRRVLLDRPIERFEAPRLSPPFPAVDETTDRIEARGKHLLMWFSGGLVLHTHMRMTGSWHLYEREATWRKAATAARVTIVTPQAVAVCFNAPVVEMLDRRAVSRHPALRRLGPDLTAPDPDIERALARMASIPAPDTTIAEVLLDQRVSSGIGNVYKSEACFLHATDPRTALHLVDVDTRRAMLETSSELLQANLSTVKRTTVPGGGDGAVWVYGREGQPCRRCRTPIRYQRVGEHARGTYWCPTCQPAAG